MFTYLLATHSFLRWLVVLGLVAGLVRFVRGWRAQTAWSKSDDRLHALLVAVVDLQLTLGLGLYFMSPLVEGFLADPGAAMSVRVLRFFGLEHITMMLVAITVLHVGRVRLRKKPEHRHAAKNLVWVSVIMFASIPWPFMPAARPLLRAPWATSATRTPSAASAKQAAPPPVYVSRCAVCHGATGHGDGPAAAGLVPRPRDFVRSPSERSKEDIVAIIRDGGARHGLSAAMPPNPDLTEQDLAELAGYLIEFADAQER